MGKFSSALEHIMRGKRLAARIHHPEGVGAVMWCPLCTKEIIRSDVGIDTVSQQRALRAHRRVCVTKGRK